MKALRLKARAETLAARSGYPATPDGKRDAMRHLIGSALFTKTYGVFLTWFAGELSELGAWIVGHNSAAQRDMDRHNNAVGREIGRTAGTEGEIVRLSHEAIDQGVAQWLADWATRESVPSTAPLFEPREPTADVDDARAAALAAIEGARPGC